jgi:predicted PurR-regulated permease PerM
MALAEAATPNRPVALIAPPSTLILAPEEKPIELPVAVQFSDWSGVIAVAVIYGAGQVIEGFFLTPRLVGERIGLNPLAVIFALLAFGQLFGFVGVLLALPASAVLMVAFHHLKRHYLRSSFYNA